MTAAKPTAGDAFEALADPTRRGVLELLRDRGVLTAGEIAAAFSRISRPAVSRHLRVLRESGLVIAEESGREWHYRINVATIARLHREWFAPFVPLWEQALTNLKEEVEGSVGEARRGA